ncbi:MAG: helical backbone metal receptor [Bacteroidota bacterium]
MECRDQLGRKLHLKHTPQRIVSLVPSQSELLVDLGLESSIVAVTKFCVHPKHLRKTKSVVGGTKQVHIEKIKAVQPDIILCNKEENTKAMIEELESIAPVHISDIYNLEDTLQLIQHYGNMFNVESKAQSLVKDIQSERAHFQFTTKINKTKKVAYFIWKDPWMVAGGNTFINTMLGEAGFNNIYADLERYPEVALEDEYLQEADIIFLSSEPYPFKDKHIDVLKSSWPQKTISIVDGELFSWYGSRLLKAYDYFKRLQN